MVIKACSYRNFWAEIPLAILWQNWQFSVTTFRDTPLKISDITWKTNVMKYQSFVLSIQLFCVLTQNFCVLFFFFYSIEVSQKVLGFLITFLQFLPILTLLFRIESRNVS